MTASPVKRTPRTSSFDREKLKNERRAFFFGAYPAMAEFDVTTLEPLVRLGYLESSSLLGYCRDDRIHDYQTNPSDRDEPLQWHVHPKIHPYDKGRQNIRVEGDGGQLTVKYMGKWFDPTTIMPLIR